MENLFIQWANPTFYLEHFPIHFRKFIGFQQQQQQKKNRSKNNLSSFLVVFWKMLFFLLYSNILCFKLSSLLEWCSACDDLYVYMPLSLMAVWIIVCRGHTTNASPLCLSHKHWRIEQFFVCCLSTLHFHFNICKIITKYQKHTQNLPRNFP